MVSGIFEMIGLERGALLELSLENYNLNLCTHDSLHSVRIPSSYHTISSLQPRQTLMFQNSTRVSFSSSLFPPPLLLPP